MTIALAVFAICLAVCVYVYLGYPALIVFISRLRPQPVDRGRVFPAVSLVIPAYNEEATIEDKLRNSLELHYPRHRLEILVVSDGSTDKTEEIVRRFEGDQVRLLPLERRGKAYALNEGARCARGEILVLTDANGALEAESLAYLVENFADPAVGGVCGNKRYRSGSGGDVTDEGENLYWRYDKWQKGLESRTGSIFAADGTLYAVRKELYIPMKDAAQADDIAISTRVVLQGYRLVYEPRAVVLEDPPRKGPEEFRRKIRVTNHSVRALLNLKGALWTSGFYSLELLSHKFLRHLLPFFLLTLVVSNAALATASLAFRLLLGLQVAFYFLGLVGFVLRERRIGRVWLFSLPYYFCLVNLAALFGVLSVVAGRRLEAWTPRAGFSAKGEFS